MSVQLDLLDLMHAPPIRRPVDGDGCVVARPDEVLRLPHPRLAWARAEIELHRHEDGLWIWATSFNLEVHGSSYRVGPKWGKFAESRTDALFYAKQELVTRLDGDSSPAACAIRLWLERLA